MEKGWIECFMPLTPTTQEVEIEKTVVQSWSQANI
jgi:hypothetical protein